MDTKIKDIDQYIANFPPDVQERLQLIRSIIKIAAPQATEKISYGMPTFALQKNLVHFAAFKNHIGFYALPSTNVAFESELKKYKTGKGSIQFPLNEKVPVALIEALVKFRVRELQ